MGKLKTFLSQTVAKLNILQEFVKNVKDELTWILRKM